MKSLYLLVHQDGTSFKIGISINPLVRAKSLKEGFDLDRSFVVQISDKGRAQALEKTVHYWFRDAQVNLPRSPGYTEWFDAAVLAHVLTFLTDHGNRLGIEAVVPFWEAVPRPLQRHVPKGSAVTEADRQGRRALRKTQRMERWAAVTASNAERAAAFETWVRDLQAGNVWLGLLGPRPGIDTGGLLFLRSAQVENIVEVALCSQWSTLEAGDGMGWCRLICGSRQASRTVVEVDVPGPLLITQDTEGNDAYFPGLTSIRLFLSSLILPETSCRACRLRQLQGGIQQRIRKEFRPWEQ